jgi:hypothetical protein
MSSLVVALVKYASPKETQKSETQLTDTDKKTYKFFKAFIFSTIFDFSISVSSFSFSAVILTEILTIPAILLGVSISLKVLANVAIIVGIIFLLSAIFIGITGIFLNRNKESKNTTLPKDKELENLELKNEALFENFKKEIKKLENLVEKNKQGKLTCDEELKIINSHLEFAENNLNNIIEILKVLKEEYNVILQHYLGNLYYINSNILFFNIKANLKGLIKDLRKKTFSIMLDVIKDININQKIDTPSSLNNIQQLLLKTIGQCLNWVTLNFPNENNENQEILRTFEEKLIAAAKNLYADDSKLYIKNTKTLMSNESKKLELNKLINSIELTLECSYTLSLFKAVMRLIIKHIEKNGLTKNDEIFNSYIKTLKSLVATIIEKTKNDERAKEYFYSEIIGQAYNLKLIVEKVKSEYPHETKLIGNTYLILLDLLQFFDVTKKEEFEFEDKTTILYPKQEDITKIIESCSNWIVTFSSKKADTAKKYKRENYKKFKEKLINAINKLNAEENFKNALKKIINTNMDKPFSKNIR